MYIYFFNISYTFKDILDIYIQTKSNILYISVYTHNSSELVPVSFSRDFVDPIGLRIWKFPTLSAFLSFCFFLWHCWPPILQGFSMSSGLGRQSWRMAHHFQGLYVKTLWKVLTWRQFPCFLAGNTNLHSGSIFQPSTLVYWRVFRYDASGLNEL